MDLETAGTRLPSAARRCGDVVVVGAGLAGLFTALKLAPIPATVIAGAPLGEGASSVWAQGGVAAAVGEDDSAEAHAADTIAAGAGIVDETVARMVAREGPERIRDLERFGVPFDRDAAGHFVLSREAAHSTRRVIRVSGDRAGAAIMQALIRAVRETPSIRVLEGYEAIGLLTEEGRVCGVRLAPTIGESRETQVLSSACAVVLATGGVGGLYALTTNPPHARGEGIAIAAEAGAVIADAEFVQFHPTALDVGLDPAPLATEALRGEGALLVNARGERFLAGVHPDAELAPRDIVARAVHAEIAAGRGAFLDCRAAIGSRFATAFPTVYAHCRAAGIDPAVTPIPIAPAEHYHMGGVLTDAHARTTVDGLWAVGEVASTGLHGANRLASNSLLEAVAFGARAAADIADRHPAKAAGARAELRAEARPPAADPARFAPLVSLLRQTMLRDVGVERDRTGLLRALAVVTAIEERASASARLSAMARAARFIIVAALSREESRGAHFRTDFPAANAALAHRSRLTLADVDAASRKHAGATEAKDVARLLARRAGSSQRSSRARGGHR